MAEANREYYVTVRDGGRTGFLLGPYPTHDGALARVEAARRHANRVNPWAAFYAFGTSSLPAGQRARTVFTEEEVANG